MKNEFKIEKDIPVPSKFGGGGKPTKYPWEQMGVGDSFVLSLEEYDVKKHSSLQTSARSWSLRNKDGEWKFSAKREDENIRIWRTK